MLYQYLQAWNFMNVLNEWMNIISEKIGAVLEKLPLNEQDDLRKKCTLHLLICLIFVPLVYSYIQSYKPPAAEIEKMAR
jgi:hypothetical protein